MKTKSEKFPKFSLTVDTGVLELLNLVVVVGTVIEVVVVLDVVVVDVVVDVVVVDVVDGENEDSTNPLRMLMMNGSSGETVVVDVVDIVVDVAGELVVNFSLLLWSLLLFRKLAAGEAMEG